MFIRDGSISDIEDILTVCRDLLPKYKSVRVVTPEKLVSVDSVYTHR